MWAMIPMLRTRSSAVVTSIVAISGLPAVVRESLVGLRHPVDVVLFLVRPALLRHRVEDLAGELLVHALLAAVTGELDEPAHSKRAGTTLRNLDGNLVVGATDAARLDLEHRGDRLDGLLERLDGRLAAPLLDEGERVVDDLLRERLLPVEHDLVHDLRDETRSMERIDLDRTRRDLRAARHYDFFAPYFERPWRRSETPAVSSAARITL